MLLVSKHNKIFINYNKDYNAYKIREKGLDWIHSVRCSCKGIQNTETVDFLIPEECSGINNDNAPEESRFVHRAQDKRSCAP